MWNIKILNGKPRTVRERDCNEFADILQTFWIVDPSVLNPWPLIATDPVAKDGSVLQMTWQDFLPDQHNICPSYFLLQEERDKFPFILKQQGSNNFFCSPSEWLPLTDYTTRFTSMTLLETTLSLCDVSNQFEIYSDLTRCHYPLE